jgi:N-dimethylarginine dimethylaminohydrolase
MTLTGSPRFLMCPPRHFAVTYSINPWMNPEEWTKQAGVLSRAAEVEWRSLKSLLEQRGAVVDLMIPILGLPDLVFTANAAVVVDGKALLARFRHRERQREEPHFAAAFESLVERNILKSCVTLPVDVVLEGAGDCIWDPHRELFWMGFGPRSSRQAAPIVEETFAAETISLELVDPRFYHLDTGFSVLADGEIMYFKRALSPNALRALHDHVDEGDRIEVDEDDACSMSLNGIRIGRMLILSGCSPKLGNRLADRGYSVSVTSLSSFLRSGGSAYCLTLRTDLTSDSRSSASQFKPVLNGQGYADKPGGRAHKSAH